MESITNLMSIQNIILYLVVTFVVQWFISTLILWGIYQARGIRKTFQESVMDMRMAVMWTFFVPFMPKLVALMIGFTTDKKTVS